MITPVATEDTSTTAAAAAALAVATASVGKKADLFTLAGDALCLAVTTALRLTESPATTPITADDDKEEILPIISLDQVSWHDNNTDCWVVVYDRVYDITEFLWEHPGGEEILLEYAGRDATLAFLGIGHGPAMLHTMERYLIGILPLEERIYSSPGGKLLGLAP